MMNTGKLSKKTAIVTGASRGIGKAIAIALAREGAHVVVNYSKSAKEAQDTLRTIEKMGATVIAVRADVSDKAAVIAMVRKTLQTFDGIDILVNNAGINRDRPVQEMTEREWDRVIDVNLKGTFLCSQAVAETMVARKSGKIITIGAQTGLRGRKNGANYCASKAGIITLTRCLAYEFAPHIQVNCIIPGFIATGEVMERYQLHHKKNLKKMLAQIPAGRLGLPEDVADMVLHLVSGAHYVTGQLILVNGGMLMH
jgi:3-oxoacyl-[acyl-carrier protein] reductase